MILLSTYLSIYLSSLYCLCNLSFLVWHIAKYNVLINGGDMNTHESKDENNKLCLHILRNRNSEYLVDIHIFLNTIFQKWNRKLWNSNNTKAQLDIFINKKFGGARGVKVIVVGIGHDTSSNPGLIAFNIALIPLGKVWIQLFSL